MIKYYMASKTHLSPMWMNHANIFYKEGFLMVSRWPYLMGHVPPEHNKGIWLNDYADIDMADCLILVAQDNDKLCGGLLEAGYAIAKGIPVFILGEHKDYGTWHGHPLVTRIPMISDYDERIKNPDYLKKAIGIALNRMNTNEMSKYVKS